VLTSRRRSGKRCPNQAEPGSKYCSIHADYVPAEVETAAAEVAKGAPEDILIQVTVHNRGPEPAELHVLPTLWFRNQWSWQPGSVKPALQSLPDDRAGRVIQAVDSMYGTISASETWSVGSAIATRSVRGPVSSACITASATGSRPNTAALGTR